MHDEKSSCCLARPSHQYVALDVQCIICCAILVPQRSLRRAQIDRTKNTSGDLCASDGAMYAGELIARDVDVATRTAEGIE